MNATRRECLPLNQVLETVTRVERDVLAYYEAAAQTAVDKEVLSIFGELAADLKTGSDRFAQVCESLNCGSASLKATQADMEFLSVLAESLFYREARDIVGLADTDRRLIGLAENALALERNLLMFHVQFHGFSCEAQQPVFWDLVQRGQERVSRLVSLRERLLARMR